jgi:hypothetical protein
MMITKRMLARRTVLRGLGVTLSLPILDAMVPAFTAVAKSAAKPIQRFHVVYTPNGMAMEYWTPTALGKDFELSPILKPLAPFRDQMLVLSGLATSWRAVHAGAATSFLTASPGGVRDETTILARTSIDQIVAKHFGDDTQLPSLELSMDNKGNAGECSANVSCTYINTIAWRTPTMPLPMENNPRAVFERLFGDGGTTEPAARRARLAQQKSILDSVLEKLVGLKNEIGTRDRVKVDEYTEAVRDVERRIQKAEQQSEMELPIIEQPAGAPAAFDDHAKLMFDLQLLALRCDLTRVITFMLGREQSSRTYAEIGVPEAHHPLSHHENDPARILQMSKINVYHTKLFADYLAQLRATPDGDGSLLDQMTILYGSGLSNSTIHQHNNLPILVLGGAAGRLKGGAHVRYPQDTPLANLLVTLMGKLDVPVESFGNSTGTLPLETLAGL